MRMAKEKEICIRSWEEKKQGKCCGFEIKKQKKRIGSLKSSNLWKLFKHIYYPISQFKPRKWNVFEGLNQQSKSLHWGTAPLYYHRIQNGQKCSFLQKGHLWRQRTSWNCSNCSTLLQGADRSSFQERSSAKTDLSWSATTLTPTLFCSIATSLQLWLCQPAASQQGNSLSLVVGSSCTIICLQ